MKRELMDILVCPMTKQALELHVDEDNDPRDHLRVILLETPIRFQYSN